MRLTACANAIATAVEYIRPGKRGVALNLTKRQPTAQIPAVLRITIISSNHFSCLSLSQK